MPTFSVKNGKLKGKLRVWASGRSLLPIHLACVASVSSRTGAKKKGGRGRGRGSFIPLPLPRPFRFFFFCSRPNFLDELARKRLLRRLNSPQGSGQTRGFLFLSTQFPSILPFLPHPFRCLPRRLQSIKIAGPNPGL